MKSKYLVILTLVLIESVTSQRRWTTTDELENHINSEDLHDFYNFFMNQSTTTFDTDNRFLMDFADAVDETTKAPVTGIVDCFGLGSISRAFMNFLNMKPDSTDKVNTHFYLSSRKSPNRAQVFPGNQFGLEWADFKPSRKTVVIIHGFMSHSNASWILDMTRALLEWGDVNVIAVDWSGGGNTWKYWRAVANTRTVGSDVSRFMIQLMNETGANVKDFHFVGHSLGAHISSYASIHCGKVARITGLDPASPCFVTENDEERLDPSDADFVDIIHTNGRLMEVFGFGIPNPIGHLDFYPNGGIKQPGCYNGTRSMWAKVRSLPTAQLEQAICSHGRAYVLFTESLINNNCSFRAYRWDLTYSGVNASLNTTCDRRGSCAEMGISAVANPRAKGSYLLLTTDKEPYCVPPEKRLSPLMSLLRDLRQYYTRRRTATTPVPAYADPMQEAVSKDATANNTVTVNKSTWLTMVKSWLGLNSKP